MTNLRERRLFYYKPSIVAIERETAALTIGDRMTSLASRDLAWATAFDRSAARASARRRPVHRHYHCGDPVAGGRSPLRRPGLSRSPGARAPHWRRRAHGMEAGTALGPRHQVQRQIPARTGDRHARRLGERHHYLRARAGSDLRHCRHCRGGDRHRATRSAARSACRCAWRSWSPAAIRSAATRRSRRLRR